MQQRPYSFLVQKGKPVSQRKRGNNSIQYIKDVAQTRGEILNSSANNYTQPDCPPTLDAQFERDLNFLVKRCFEERIEKPLEEEVYPETRLRDILAQINTLQRQQYRSIQPLDAKTRYHVLNRERIITHKIRELRELYRETLANCRESVPPGTNFEFRSTGYNNDSPQLNGFKRIIMNRGMTFVNDNHFEDRLVSDISLRFLDTTASIEAIIPTNQRIVIPDEQPDPFKPATKRYQDRKGAVRMSVLPRKATLSTAESLSKVRQQRAMKSRVSFRRRLPIFIVDVDTTDPAVYQLFFAIGGRKPCAFPQFSEITRQQFTRYLSRCFVESMVHRMLNFLQFPATITFVNYKKWLQTFNSWSHENILFYVFHIFDTGRQGVLNSTHLMNLLKYRSCFAEDAHVLLSTPLVAADTDQAHAILLQQPDLTFAMYRTYLQQDQLKKQIISQNRLKKQQLFTEVRAELLEIKTIELSSHHVSQTQQSPVKDLYEDTRQYAISYGEFLVMFHDRVPKTFMNFIEAISLKRIDGSPHPSAARHYLKLVED